jgi:hypothetical protein
MRYYLLFFELQIKSYEFYKIQLDSGLKFLFGSGLNREPTRGVMPLADTGSCGSGLWAIGFKMICAARIGLYHFD